MTPVKVIGPRSTGPAPTREHRVNGYACSGVNHGLHNKGDILCHPADERSMPSKSTLNVSFTPELTVLIAAKVSTGLYRSASEVVCAALRLLDEQDRREARHEVKPASGGRNAR